MSTVSSLAPYPVYDLETMYALGSEFCVLHDPVTRCNYPAVVCRCTCRVDFGLGPPVVVLKGAYVVCYGDERNNFAAYDPRVVGDKGWVRLPSLWNLS